MGGRGAAAARRGEGCSDAASALGRAMATAVHRLSSEREQERAPCLQQERDGTMWGGARSRPLDALMVCWGLGTWLGVNGLYVQLPLLVEALPEGWALPASMTLAVQLANVGLLLYVVLKRLLPRVRDPVYVCALLAIGTVALALNAFLHPQTAFIGSTERSVPFLALTFFAALVGCTSSVLFYPYLRHFRDVYLATYLVGEGLSGFVPAVLALAQGGGGEPDCSSGFPVYPPARFSITVFLLLLSVLSALSLVSFVTIDRSAAFEPERVTPAAVVKDEEATAPQESLLSSRWAGLLALTVVLNALANGVLPSVQSYSCIPYGTTTYHLAVTLGAMANPVACLVGVFARPLSARALRFLLVAASPALAYIITTAAMSPLPPLAGSGWGAALVVAAWVWSTLAVSYARMWVYGWARRGGARGMRATGAATQLGSAGGSLLLFALVNYAHVFTQPPACPT